MKFKKALIAPAALVLAVAGLASCGGDKPKRADVVFWSNVYGDREEAWATQVVKDFNAKYPDISVDIVKAGRYGDINEKVNANLVTPKKLPNLVVGYPDFFINYIDKLVNFDTFMDDTKNGFGKVTTKNEKGEEVTADETDTKKSDIVDAYLEEGKVYPKTGTYSLPFGKTSEAFFTNTAAFTELNAQVPTTFDEAIAVARLQKAAHPERYTLLDKKGNETINKGKFAPISFHSASNFLITSFKMKGIPYASNEDANNNGKLEKNEAVLFNNADAKAWIKELKGYFDERLFTTKEISGHKSVGGQAYVENDFVKENPSSIMIFDSTKGTSYVANSANEINDRGEKWESKGAKIVAQANPVLNYSDAEGSKAIATNQGGSVAMFDHGKESNEKAWLFYKFMTNTQNSGSYSVANSTAPARKSAYELDAVKEIVNGKDTKVDIADQTNVWSNHFKKLNGEVFEIYKGYTDNNQLYAAPVNAFSSKQRSAIESMFVNIMLAEPDSKNTIDQIIDREFTNAYDII